MNWGRIRVKRPDISYRQRTEYRRNRELSREVNLKSVGDVGRQMT